MSNAPETGYPPTGYPSAPPNPAQDAGWRIVHSLWLLLPILGFSCLGGFGFLYVGLRAKRPAWWLSGIVYLLIGWPAFFLVGEQESDSLVSDVAVGVVMAVWIGSIVHAALINPAWLRWRANYRSWYAQPAAPDQLGSHSQPFAAPPPTTALFPPPTTYYGPGPAAAVSTGSTGPARPAEPREAAALESVPETVDVNRVGAEQLAALPGFDLARARHVLAERERRGGFGSVTEFVAVANLAPHEYAPLRDVLVCQPPPPAGFSGLPPQGRVVDV